MENERQYLKSQLQSEITCKDELREALTTATRQLGDIKVILFVNSRISVVSIAVKVFRVSSNI